jgi:hypothetical protein
MTRAQWLYRDLIQGPHLFLATTEAEYHRAMAHCTVAKGDRPGWVSAGKSAKVHYLTNPKGQLVCIVTVSVPPDVTAIQVCGLLVHEAVHVWQRFCEDIGEDEPSCEFEAYGIQAIAQRLMQAYSDQMA